MSDIMFWLAALLPSWLAIAVAVAYFLFPLAEEDRE